MSELENKNLKENETTKNISFVDFFAKRIHNYFFWTALFALIPAILQMFGVVEIPNEYKGLCNSILAFLIAAGVVNDPTTGKGLSD